MMSARSLKVLGISDPEMGFEEFEAFRTFVESEEFVEFREFECENEFIFVACKRVCILSRVSN